MILLPVMESHLKISERWKNPEEGFSEEQSMEAHDESMRVGLSHVTSVIRSVGSDASLELVGKLAIDLIKHGNNETHEFLGLMLVSQLGEFIEKASEIDGYMEIMIMQLQR